MKEIILLLYTSMFTVDKPDALMKLDSITHRNWIEIGRTSVAFIGKGGQIMLPYKAGYPSFFTYKYQLRKRGLICIEYHYYNENNLPYFSLTDVGKNLRSSYKLASLGYTYLLRDGNLRILLGGDIAYRWGKGHDVLTQYIQQPGPNPPIITIENTPFNSPGIGFSTEFNYVFLNRITTGVSAHYEYFFEKSQLAQNKLKFDDNSEESYYDYKVNKQLLALHLKIGVLF